MIGIRRKKLRRRLGWILCVCAVVTTIATGVLAVIYVNHKKVPMKEIRLYRLTRDVSKGEQLVEDAFEQVNVYTDVTTMISDAKTPYGGYAKTDMWEGDYVEASMVYTEEAPEERYQEFSGIQIFAGVQKGAYIDVRIQYSNGEDYIVLEHKRVEDISSEGGIVLCVKEDEILKMASAQMDLRSFANTKLYAVKYITDYQEAAIPYYLLNEDVLTLAKWDPNVVAEVLREQDSAKRELLESKLRSEDKDA